MLFEQEVLRKNGFRAAGPEEFDRSGQDGGEEYLSRIFILLSVGQGVTERQDDIAARLTAQLPIRDAHLLLDPSNIIDWNRVVKSF